MTRWAIILVAGCSFEHGNLSNTPKDGASIDGTPNDALIDVPIDAAIDAVPDARVCPAAPTSCTLFECGGTSSCYYICGGAGKRTWSNANSYCTTQARGCLATINDVLEDSCIDTATNPTFSGTNFVWFGFRQTNTTVEPAGNWGWECGSSTYVHNGWGGGEPNDSGGNEDCAALTDNGGWFDGGCGTVARFVCELP